MNSLTLLVNGLDVTEQASGITHSCVDPGGWEVLSYTIPNAELAPTVGSPVVLFDGMEIVWEGRVEEPAEDTRDAVSAHTVQCIGSGAVMKDNPYAMIYVDSELSRWTQTSRARQDAFASASTTITGPSVQQDESSGNDALKLALTGAWPAGTCCEAMYDAGPLCDIYAIYHWWERSAAINSADVQWQWYVALSEDDAQASATTSANLRSAGPDYDFMTWLTDPPPVVRFGFLRLRYNTAAGTSGMEYPLWWRPVVIGRHGLTVRGSAIDDTGLYHPDIVRHAAAQADVAIGRIDTDTSFHVTQSAYIDPVFPEQVVDDMSKYSGWHWGVWSGVNPGNPELWYCAPPTKATVYVDRSACDSTRFAQRLSDLHDAVYITFTEVSGRAGAVLVERDNPRFTEPERRTAVLNIGQSTSAVAQTFGEMLLALEEQQSRAAGSVVVSGSIPSGRGDIPVNHIKAGRDRIQITGLDNAGPWTETDTRRFDAFRISRSTVSYQSGRPIATLELDAGSSLIEVLQARLAGGANSPSSGGGPSGHGMFGFSD
jgi:hypothetical protein